MTDILFFAFARRHAGISLVRGLVQAGWCREIDILAKCHYLAHLPCEISIVSLFSPFLAGLPCCKAAD